MCETAICVCKKASEDRGWRSRDEFHVSLGKMVRVSGSSGFEKGFVIYPRSMLASHSTRHTVLEYPWVLHTVWRMVMLMMLWGLCGHEWPWGCQSSSLRCHSLNLKCSHIGLECFILGDSSVLGSSRNSSCWRN